MTDQHNPFETYLMSDEWQQAEQAANERYAGVESEVSSMDTFVAVPLDDPHEIVRFEPRKSLLDRFAEPILACSFLVWAIIGAVVGVVFRMARRKQVS